VLAVWEKEPVIHLFRLDNGAHTTVPKPVPKEDGFVKFFTEDLFFDANGRDAIVFVGGASGSYGNGSFAYRVALDGQSEPIKLFGQVGFRLHASPRGAVMMIAKSRQFACTYNGCDVESIRAYTFGAAGSTETILMSAGTQRVDGAQAVLRGDVGERFAAIVMTPPKRTMLRWSFGDAAASLQELARGDNLFQPQLNLLTRKGEIVEIATGSDPQNPGAELVRHQVDGTTTTTIVPAIPAEPGDPGPIFQYDAFGERAGGGLWLHWANYLFLAEPDGSLRRYPIGSVRKGGEWAGADIYVEQPESLWLGLDAGGGRRFVEVGLEPR
jgi:hypothetical protein